MAHYFLHQRGGAAEFTDEEGQDLPDLDAARRCAIGGIRGILADEVMHGRFHLDERIDICDVDGRPLLSVPFSEAVAVAS
jgi:hypothetical protein